MDINNIEEAIVRSYFKPLLNIVVPNVSHSFFYFHEADIISLSPAGYATEVEIKTTRADLVADKKKGRWGTFAPKGGPLPKLIKYMWFAGPKDLEADLLEHVPLFAGIITVEKKWYQYHDSDRGYTYYICNKVRKAPVNPNHIKWSNANRMKLMRLGYLRYVSRVWKAGRTY
jgi:hypothetical protein